MKFLLIRPAYKEEKNKSGFINSKNLPPLGLLYIGASLEQDGHKVELLDYYAENISKEKLKNSLISSDAVGLTVYTNDYKPALEISRLIKDTLPTNNSV